MYKYNHFSLQPIIDFVKLIPRLPVRDKLKNSNYGKYQFVVGELIREVPNIAGWYLWINIMSDKKEIYVGKSEQGLYNRFVDRFNQEYTIFWEAVHGPHPFIEDAYKMFPQKNYRIAIENCRCKSIGTHIIWVSKEIVAPDECEQVERELFVICDPVCNKRKPKTNGSFRNVANEVAQLFSKEIVKIEKKEFAP